MRARASIVCLGLLLPAPARADELPPDEKAAKMSMRVDAEVPAGKALILVNTFRGADLVPLGAVVPIEWHPARGAMQLRLVAAEVGGKLPPLRDRLDLEAIRPLAESGVACGPPIPGVRTLSTNSPAVELRYAVQTTITGETCTAEVSQQYLDAAGKPVGPGQEPPPPPPTAADLLPAKAADPAKAAEPAKPATPAKAGSGCRTTTAGPLGLAALIGLAALGRRRRR